MEGRSSSPRLLPALLPDAQPDDVQVQVLELDRERAALIGHEVDPRGVSRCDCGREVVAVHMNFLFDVCADD